MVLVLLVYNVLPPLEYPHPPAPCLLKDNAIGDDGVIHMTEALMRNGRLRTVCLDGNQVSVRVLRRSSSRGGSNSSSSCC